MKRSHCWTISPTKIATRRIVWMSHQRKYQKNGLWKLAFSKKDDDDFVEEKKVAVILNRNAGNVREEMIPIAEELFGKENVFVTHNVQEAREAAHQLIQNLDQYRLFVPIGGDGTLSCLLQFLIEDSSMSSPDDVVASLPPLAYLPMGTGNALGSVVGNNLPRAPIHKLWSHRRRQNHRLQAFRTILESFDNYNNNNNDDDESKNKNDATVTMIQVPLMQVTASMTENGEQLAPQLCFFAGAGFDSLLLDDYRIMMGNKRKTKFQLGTNAIIGYTTALLTKTLPKTSLKYNDHLVNMKLYHNRHTTDNVTDGAEPIYWVDHRRGDWFLPIVTPTSNGTSTLLFEGNVGIVAAGTCPFYGGGLRLFPFAGSAIGRHKPFMHLRIARIHPLQGFFNVFSIFQGSFRDTSPENFGVLDLIGSSFTIELLNNSSYPLQHSGESIGNVRSFQLETLHNKIKFASLLPPPPLLTNHG